MKRLVILIALVLLPLAARGQTYTRPSKGITTTILSAGQLSSATVLATSQVYNWSGFAGVEVGLNTNGLTSAGCAFYPRVEIYEGDSPTSLQAWASDESIAHVLTTNDYRYFPIASTYVEFKIRSVASPTSGNVGHGSSTACTVDATITPIPFELHKEPIQYAALSQTFSITSTPIVVWFASNGTPFFAGSTFSRPSHLIVQNLGTKVVLCGVVVGTSSSPLSAAPSNFPLVLSAGAASTDGTGGSLTLEGFDGPLWCETSGSDTSTIGVVAY